MKLLLAAIVLVLSVGQVEAGWFNRERPSHCPQVRWCGCWLANYLGLSDSKRELWRASRWASLGHRVRGPMKGAIAVWPHHVGLITDVPARGQIVLLSGNDNREVRERARSTKGVMAYVLLP